MQSLSPVPISKGPIPTPGLTAIASVETSTGPVLAEGKEAGGAERGERGFDGGSGGIYFVWMATKKVE